MPNWMDGFVVDWSRLVATASKKFWCARRWWCADVRGRPAPRTVPSSAGVAGRVAGVERPLPVKL